MVIASQIGRIAAGSAAAAGTFVMANKVKSEDSVAALDSYPPNGLSAGVKALPQWIQAGCGGT
jgi:hypothetical protein